MGFWGSTLYANDCASDVKDSYLDMLKADPGEDCITEKIIVKFHEYLGTDEEPLFWYALADIQWQAGRLHPQVREMALEWLAREGGLNLWADSKTKGSGWKKTMDKLEARLNTPQPPKKRINRTPVVTNPWNVGDVYAYQFHSEKAREAGLDQKYILIQKIEEGTYGSLEMRTRIRVFDQVFDHVPDPPDLSRMRILPLTDPKIFAPHVTNRISDKLVFSVVLLLSSNRQYPKKHLTYLGQYPIPEDIPPQPNWGNLLFWGDLGDSLSYFYTLWQDYDYEDGSEKSTVTPRRKHL